MPATAGMPATTGMPATAGRPATQVLRIISQKQQVYWQHNSRDNNITDANISRDACNNWDASNSRNSRNRLRKSSDASNTMDAINSRFAGGEATGMLVAVGRPVTAETLHQKGCQHRQVH
jgi:hypothetical protein